MNRMELMASRTDWSETSNFNQNGRQLHTPEILYGYFHIVLVLENFYICWLQSLAVRF